MHPIAALQSEYSPITLDIEAEDEVHGVMKACRELGVKVIAYSPLGRGFLTGQIVSPGLPLCARALRRATARLDCRMAQDVTF